MEDIQKVLDDLYADNAKKLHQMCHKKMKRYGGISQKDYDDFYSIANYVCADIEVNNKYDLSKGSFESFLYGCLEKRFISYIDRLNNTNKEKANTNAVSIDIPVNDGDEYTIGDMLQSDFDIDEEIIKRTGNYDENVEKYLKSLSKIQRRIVEMKMDDVSVSDIKKELDLTDKQYEDNMKSIKQNKMISLFNKTNRSKIYKKKEDINMDMVVQDKLYDNTMDLDTTDNYRMDKYPLKSLLEDKMEGEIDCNYISQRQPFQWDEEQVNKFYSRILNNQPIPEIVICETIESGDKISYLIDGLQRLSYAEEFKENRMAIRMKGAEFTNIKYKRFETDKEGRKIYDENGRPKYTIETFDIVGKYYRELPEFLQKRFDNFNVNVTRFFGCTSEMIDYHMRNYNNHVAMTKSQYGITNVSNNTSRNIKTISEQHTFFKDNVKCTNKSRKKGVLDETVARTIMAMYFLDDWKKDLIDVLRYIEKNASDKHFEHLKENLDRFSKVADKSVQDLLNTTNTPVWLVVFDEFTNLRIPDKRFIEFMRIFKTRLHDKEIDGVSYEMINTRNTKDKKTVANKINIITKLMFDYFVIPLSSNL